MGNRSGTEQVDFTVVATLPEDVEVRDYGPRVLAETAVPADSDSPSSAAFQRLFDYIQGANQAQAEIAMTAPVETETPASSQKIAMTAPVETETDNGVYRMAFFLPKGTTLTTAPVPTSSDVSLREVSARLEAVKRFSGSRADEAVARETQALLDLLATSDWQPTGTPRSYFYDPPWTLPPLRRNEVAVPVSQRTAS